MAPLVQLTLAAVLITPGQVQLLAEPSMPIPGFVVSGDQNDPNDRTCPVSASDHDLRGDRYWAEGRFALAAEAYETATRLGLDSPAIHLKLAKAYLNLNNSTGSTEARTVPNGIPGRIQEGVYLIEPLPNEPGRFLVAPKTSAIHHLQQAVDAGLDGPHVRLLEADIWLRARRFAKALDIYATLQGKVPAEDQYRYYRHFAEACLATDDVEGYLDRLEKAAALDREPDPPMLAAAYLRAAQRYAADADLPNYIRCLKLALEQDPESADLHYRLGNAFDDASRPERASLHWRITLELQPDHPDRRRMLEAIRDISRQSNRAP